MHGCMLQGRSPWEMPIVACGWVFISSAGAALMWHGCSGMQTGNGELVERMSTKPGLLCRLVGCHRRVRLQCSCPMSERIVLTCRNWWSIERMATSCGGGGIPRSNLSDSWKGILQRQYFALSKEDLRPCRNICGLTAETIPNISAQ